MLSQMFVVSSLSVTRFPRCGSTVSLNTSAMDRLWEVVLSLGSSLVTECICLCRHDYVSEQVCESWGQNFFFVFRQLGEQCVSECLFVKLGSSVSITRDAQFSANLSILNYVNLGNSLSINFFIRSLTAFAEVFVGHMLTESLMQCSFASRDWVVRLQYSETRVKEANNSTKILYEHEHTQR